LPEDEFRLYAVCSRYPHNLASAVALRPLQAGVYECRRGTDEIRVIVANELPRTENNALLHLLSASPEQVRYGVAHYRQRAEETSTLLDQLYQGYQREGLAMPYTMEDFRCEYILEHLAELPPDVRRKALQRLSAVELLEALSPEERREALKALSPEERLADLSPEVIEEYLKRHKQKPAPRKRQKKS
jgi:hypothetical protein